jgi:ubiquinone/menaquinone biosynthesis C-methylase UbiE
MASFRREGWKKQILENAPSREVLKILDCGCGPGFFSMILADEGHDVVGVDGSTEMMRYAKQRAENYGLDIDFRIMDCHELQFEDGSFDLVVSRNVTHTLREHKTVYQQWLRVLKPGGVLLIFDANWHLPGTDEAMLEDSRRRHRECIEKYGEDFNGNKTVEEVEKAHEARTKKDDVNDSTVWKHVLHDKRRPDWDVGLLEGIGFCDITYDRDITEELWDDKEKLIYGNTPMFMVRAVKAE